MGKGERMVKLRKRCCQCKAPINDGELYFVFDGYTYCDNCGQEVVEEYSKEHCFTCDYGMEELSYEETHRE